MNSMEFNTHSKGRNLEIMSKPIGFVCETKSDTVKFYLDKKARISFGQIVRIKSVESQFYARVVNAQSSSTLQITEQLRHAEGKEVFGPYSCFRSVEAVLFLEKIEGKIRAPTFNPDYKDQVYATEEEDHSILKLAGEMNLGLMRSGKQVLGSVGIDIDSIPRMMGMFGMTGSGKTNTELILNAQLIDNSPKTVALIFDFAGQLLEGKEIKSQKGLKDHPLFHMKVRYYSARDKKLTVGLRTIRPEKLSILFSDLSYPQRRFAQALYKQYGETWIESALKIYEEGEKFKTKADKKASAALMQKLSSLPEDLFPLASYSVIEDIVKNICDGITCLIDISGLREEDQKRLVCLIAFTVAKKYKWMWEERYKEWQKLPTLLITLEEAHEFLDPASPKTIFSDIALTYRKYRVGLNAVTPRPSRIDFDVFAELWTKVIMKTELKNDRKYLTDNTPYMEYSDTEIKMLDIGEALLISEPKIRFAVPIKVLHYPEYLKQRKAEDYGLPDSPALKNMDESLKRLNKKGKSLFQEEWERGTRSKT